MRSVAILAAVVAAAPALAESLVAARTLRPQHVLTHEDVALSPAQVPGALTEAGDAVGLETRVAIYAGRPIRPGDLGPPAVVERNALVVLRYRAGPLAISAEGRALDRASPGDMIRVMNLQSRTIITGRVRENGAVQVSGTLP